MDGTNGQSPGNNLPAKSRSRDGRRRNALSHGLRATSLGGWPKGSSYVAKLVHQFRRALEAELIAAKGSISLVDACHVSTAARWERHALLCGRWMKISFESLTHDQRLAYSRDIARASESRDRAIAALKLDRDPQTLLASLYGPVITPAIEGP